MQAHNDHLNTASFPEVPTQPLESSDLKLSFGREASAIAVFCMFILYVQNVYTHLRIIGSGRQVVGSHTKH